MAGEVRRQVILTHDEDEQLRERARERGISEEDLIRDAVREALRTKIGHPLAQEQVQARAAWKEVMTLLRVRAALPVPSEEHVTGRGWTRDEIYDERFKPLSD